MTIETKNKMIKRGRIILNGPLEYLWNYSISISFGVIGLAGLVLGFQFNQQGSSPGQMTNKEILIWVGFVWLFVLV